MHAVGSLEHRIEELLRDRRYLEKMIEAYSACVTQIKYSQTRSSDLEDLDEIKAIKIIVDQCIDANQELLDKYHHELRFCFD